MSGKLKKVKTLDLEAELARAKKEISLLQGGQHVQGREIEKKTEELKESTETVIIITLD